MFLGVFCGYLLETVPECSITEGEPVHRKVALKNAAVRTKTGDGMVIIPFLCFNYPSFFHHLNSLVPRSASVQLGTAPVSQVF